MKVKELLGTVSLENGLFLNIDSEIMSVVFNNGRNQNYDTQEMVMVSEHEFLAALDRNDLKVVRFVDLLTNKNPLNYAIKNDLQPKKARNIS